MEDLYFLGLDKTVASGEAHIWTRISFVSFTYSDLL